VRRNGGRVEARSEGVGRGSRFTVTLRAAPGASARAEAASTQSGAAERAEAASSSPASATAAQTPARSH
jgi:hypothetical protein